MVLSATIVIDQVKWIRGTSLQSRLIISQSLSHFVSILFSFL
jgi:hypothetical protein